MRERLDRANDSAEMTPSIEVVEKALAQVKSERRDYLRVIKRYYLSRRNEIEIASEWNRSANRVRDLLKQAKACTAGHIQKLEAVD